MDPYPGVVGTSYLDLLRSVLKAEKRRTYEAMGIRAGDVVLDVGCGPATDTIDLAELVGPTGRVVGIDHDVAMVAEANARAAAAGLAENVTHLRADASRLPFDDATFDAVRSERVFQHLADPSAALAEMVRVTRLEGRVVVFDTDHSTRALDTPYPEIEERLNRHLCGHMIVNPRSGRQLHRLFVEAGLRDVRAEARSTATGDLDFIRTAGTLDAVEEAALAAGVVSEAEIARWRAWMAEAGAQGTLFGYWTMVLATGVKR